VLLWWFAANMAVFMRLDHSRGRTSLSTCSCSRPVISNFDRLEDLALHHDSKTPTTGWDVPQEWRKLVRL
jgi:hypothetical protein